MGEAKQKALNKLNNTWLKKLDRGLIILVNSIAILTIPLWAWVYIWGVMIRDLIKGEETHLFEKFFWEQ